MQPPDAALLFAAGLGTRMAPLTDTRPKPLIEVAGRPLFDHALALVRDAGVEPVIANTHYFASKLSRHLAKRDVLESHEPTLLDTGGGLKRACRSVRADVMLTLNTDAVWSGDNPIPALRNAWDPDRMDALLVLVPRDRAMGHRGPGDFVLGPKQRLQWGPGMIYTGMQFIKTEPFLAERETIFGMRGIWTHMVAEQRAFGIVHTGHWCDVGQPESIPLAETLLDQCHD